MRVLYLEGDPCSPKYVRGSLQRLGFDVQEVVQEPYDGAFSGFDAIILSDYEADVLGDARMDALVRAVEDGAGLVMVGGWTSFGRGGFADTAVGRILPISMREGDDRVARPSGAFLLAPRAHAVTDGLPFDAPPVITGWNHVEPRGRGMVLMEAREVRAVTPGRLELSNDAAPILVAGEHGRGRTLALATDLSPHWSGGWTDWGDRLVSVTDKEQVGVAYLRFIAQLCAFAARAPVPDAAREVLADA